jgi:acyl-CoA reductase-like NAD-dependent aldehyde dehydrogenase
LKVIVDYFELTFYRAVHINSMTVHDEAVLPHGGVKRSGFGRFNGTAGLQEFLRSKTVTWQD